MVRPNFIPRTLRGVGGVKLFDLPGVIYPKEVLRAKPGMNRKSGKPYSEPPPWGISTREASVILCCTPAAARLSLHKHRVTYRLVSQPGHPLSLYWKKDQVLQLAQSRLPLVREQPPKLISSEEALRLLGVGRSSLHRYTIRGRLHVTQVRFMSPRGTRKRAYFQRAEVVRLAHHLRALRRQAMQLREMERTAGTEEWDDDVLLAAEEEDFFNDSEQKCSPPPPQDSPEGTKE